jgi:hypothetical protein
MRKKQEHKKSRMSQLAEIGCFHRLAITETLKRYEGLTLGDVTCLLAMNTICDDYMGYFTVYHVIEYTGYKKDVAQSVSKKLIASGQVAFFCLPHAYATNKYYVTGTGKAVCGYYVRCMKNVVEQRICNYNPALSPYAFSLLHNKTGLRRADREKLEKRQEYKRKKRNRKNPPK